MALQNSSIDDMNTFLNKIYCVPNYQREYSWEIDELDDFWRDLVATIKEGEDETHFFGQIVVHDDLDLKKKFIIDGQQRTTTSMIFLRAMQVLYGELFKSSDNKGADYKRTDIESIYLGREGERHLTLGDLDNEFFEKEVLSAEPGSSTKKKKKSHERLRVAYNYFDHNIREYISDCVNSEDQLETLNVLYNTFTKRFKVLYMEATKLEEAFVIFETLNARGKDLETSDLLKNYILNQSKDIDVSLKKWNSMISSLDKCDPTKYIRNYWNATHDFTREKALYRAINKSISTPKNTKEFLENLGELAVSYHDMVVPGEGVSYSKDIKQVFITLKTLKASTFYPVILAMKAQGGFADDDLLRVLQAIECYVFRNFTIYGRTANSAETYFANLAKEIYEENYVSSEEICLEIKNGIISDEEFFDAFKRWSGTKSSKDTIRYILRRIHKYLDKSNELNIDNTDVHIEHIMPEDNTKWKVDEDFHDEYLWRLGNLCLLSGTYNIEISNKVFLEKCEIYKKSKIEPNKEIATVSKWNDEAIEKRQCKFAEYALEIWKK